MMQPCDRHACDEACARESKDSQRNGVTHEHWDEREDLWLDFMADTGRADAIRILPRSIILAALL